MAERINKARYWWGVLYPENMLDKWEEKIADTLQLPFAYAFHTADVDSKSEHRKDHIHLIVAFNNTTTYKHAMSIFDLLSADGKKALNKIEACVNIRHCYDYLIHDTDSCRKDGKHLYRLDERITGNLFDIGAYEQVGAAQKTAMLRELCDYIVEFRIQNMTDFYIAATQNFDDEYFEVIKTYNAMLERMTRGNYLKYSKKKIRVMEGYECHRCGAIYETREKADKCAECGD